MKLNIRISILAAAALLFAGGCKSDQNMYPGPAIHLANPAAGATGVARNIVIAVKFNMPLYPASVNSTTFTVAQGINPVAGVIAYTDTSATFTPTNSLAPLTTYTVSLTTGIRNLKGIGMAANTGWVFTTGGTNVVLGAVGLGSAINYVILGKSAINNSSITSITGDLGLSPAATTYITGLALTDATGYATSAQVTGKVYAADMADPTPINLTTAVANMITAYNDAAGRPLPDYVELGAGNIGGKTLAPGLYKWTSTVSAPTSITLSGGPNDVWIFQIAGNLTVSSSVNMTLTGGAQARNIFWQVAGEVSIGTTAHVEGIFLSMTAITFQTGASLKGRALAQTAVVLDSNTIVIP